MATQAATRRTTRNPITAVRILRRLIAEADAEDPAFGTVVVPALRLILVQVVLVLAIVLAISTSTALLAPLWIAIAADETCLALGAFHIFKAVTNTVTTVMEHVSSAARRQVPASLAEDQS